MKGELFRCVWIHLSLLGYRRNVVVWRRDSCSILLIMDNVEANDKSLGSCFTLERTVAAEMTGPETIPLCNQSKAYHYQGILVCDGILLSCQRVVKSTSSSANSTNIYFALDFKFATKRKDSITPRTEQ